MVKRLRYYVGILKMHFRESMASRKGPAAYWTEHMVDVQPFSDADMSLKHFAWRNAQYPGYIELMPVSGYDGKVIVDYGCGPGNDLTGFSVYSNPKRLIGMDVSPSALEASARRLKTHGKTVELFQIEENSNTLQIESNTVDLIHSSGVLHHCKNLQAVMEELHRILKPGGEMQIMVYNYNSIWLHLYTAYIIQIEQGKYKDDNIFEAFRKTTDGAFCPIAWCYTPEQFISIVEKFGFKGEFTGASTSMTEMRLLPRRFDAIENKIFPAEHREFLSGLSFDKNGVPLYKGQVAGINACFRFKKL